MSDRIMFNTKIDAWILALLLIAVTLCLGGIVQNWESISGAYWWVGALLGMAILILLWPLVTTRYYLSDTKLLVRCGPLSWEIDIGDIQAVEPAQSSSASPALSTDRLRIDYGGGRRIEISPVPRQAFLQQLDYRRRQIAGHAQSPASS